MLLTKIKKLAVKGLKAVAITTAVVAAGMVALHTVRANAADNPNCDANSVVWCGATSSSILETRYTSGDGHNSATSIHDIYTWFGISSSDISSMNTTAVEGSVSKNGDVYAGSTLVATGALTGGRQNISGSIKRTENGTTFYTRAPSVSFLQGSLTAMVVMKDGVFQFAILHACGNPIKATPKKPNYSIVKQVRAGTSGSYSSDVTVKSGSVVSYQITVNSTGAVPVTNVTVHDTLPSGITYTSGTLQENGAAVSSANASNFFGSGLLISSIKNGSNDVFTFSAVAGAVKDTDDSCKPASLLNNEGYISAPGLGNQQSGATVSTTCTPQVALSCVSLVPTAGAIDATTGNQVYQLVANATVKNATITGYAFIFGDGKNQTVTSSATSASASHTYAPGSYAASVTVNATANGKTYTATAPGCQTNITVKPAPAAACTLLTAIASDRTNFALNATATASNGATIQGYDFTVKNSGGTTVVSKSVDTTNQTASTNVTLNDEGTYQAQVSVRTSLGALTSEPCKATITVTPAPNPNVTITKYVDNVKREQVAVNQNFVYEVKVTNIGNVDLTNAVVTDPAPQGVTMVSTDLGTIANNALSYTIPSLKIGDSVSFNITAKVVAYQAGDIVNTACVNAPEVNPSQPTKPDACDTATVTVTPPPVPGVTITKTVDGKKQEQVATNQNFVYQLVITNTGNQDLTNVVVTDPAPQGVTMISTDTGTIVSNALSYTIPSLKIGASVTINITATVPAQVAGDIVNTACVNAPEVNPTQPDKTDACDTATVTLTPLPPTLPNTGAGNVISIFFGVVATGTIGYRLFLSRKLARR